MSEEPLAEEMPVDEPEEELQAEEPVSEVPSAEEEPAEDPEEETPAEESAGLVPCEAQPGAEEAGTDAETPDFGETRVFEPVPADPVCGP